MVAAMPAEPLACSAVLTHHWLVRRRGGEKVLEALAELVREADIYTLVHDRAGYPLDTVVQDVAPVSNRCPPRIMTSFLQRIPGAIRRYPKFLPLMPRAARSMKLPDVDLVLCSDAAIAKAMRPNPRSRVVCYCHSPMRYVWEPEISAQYRATLPAALRPLWPALCTYVRRADRRAAARVNQFVANSAAVAERIRRCYGRESIVVHPPVELPAAPGSEKRDDFYLCVGYHVAYKKLWVAYEAAMRLGARLVVIGEGPDVESLRRACVSKNVTLLGYQPDEIVRDHYRKAKALLFPGEEDFGIVPVEAMAHGCPVIAFARGGACETVIDGQTGVLYDRGLTADLVQAMMRADTMTFDPRTMFNHMQRFNRDRFLQQMRATITTALQPRPV
jgi:glycosyltransferase involved in cell wall biosynthesis